MQRVARDKAFSTWGIEAIRTDIVLLIVSSSVGGMISCVGCLLAIEKRPLRSLKVFGGKSGEANGVYVAQRYGGDTGRRFPKGFIG